VQCGITLQQAEISQGRCMQCIATPPYFDRTDCLDRYHGRLQNAVHLLKYQNRLAYAHGLAQVWNQFMSEHVKNHDANFLLPVPLSRQKLCARGFNQSWEIARRIECPERMQKLPRTLLRSHHPQQQALASKLARELAIRDQFYINPLYRTQLKHQTVVVFDDVMTTGATLNEIARILKDNGVSRVINWVVLRTPEPQ
jgi:ComF family protein